MTNLGRSHHIKQGSATPVVEKVAMPERLQRRLASDNSEPPRSSEIWLPTSSYAVQLFADAVSAGVHATESVQRAAAHGLSGSSRSLPHLDAIQLSFGRHDVSSVQAHVGGRAAEGAGMMGARGYAAGNSVAFATSPDLHLTAHEAAHVVQQRAGVHLKGGVGEVGDSYERHADAVADLVVQGKSAESLLDQMAPSNASSTGVQLDAIQRQVGDHVDPRTGRDAQAESQRMLERIRSLTDLQSVRAMQVALATAASHRGAPSDVAQIQVSLPGGGTTMVLESQLPSLMAAAEQQAATLEVATTGTTLSGLEGQIPEPQLQALSALVQRLAYSHFSGVEEVIQNMTMLAQLTTGITQIDPRSRASIQQVSVAMQVSLEAAHQAGGQAQLTTPHGDEESMAEHQEEEESYQDAGREISEGGFAAVAFICARVSGASRARSANWAHVAHQLDEMLNAAGMTLETRHAEFGGYDSRGRLEPEPTVPHSVEGREAHAPQPVDAPVATDGRAAGARSPSPARPGESPMARGARERASQARDARRPPGAR